MSELNKALEETNLEKLQKFLNQCIELGRKPREVYYKGKGDIAPQSIAVDAGGVTFSFLRYGEDYRERKYSIHDLFAVESGILGFVDWSEPEQLGDVTTPMYQIYGARGVHKYRMSDDVAMWKIDYFLKNALLPTTTNE